MPTLLLGDGGRKGKEREWGDRYSKANNPFVDPHIVDAMMGLGGLASTPYKQTHGSQDDKGNGSDRIGRQNARRLVDVGAILGPPSINMNGK